MLAIAALMLVAASTVAAQFPSPLGRHELCHVDATKKKLYTFSIARLSTVLTVADEQSGGTYGPATTLHRWNAEFASFGGQWCPVANVTQSWSGAADVARTLIAQGSFPTPPLAARSGAALSSYAFCDVYSVASIGDALVFFWGCDSYRACWTGNENANNSLWFTSAACPGWLNCGDVAMGTGDHCFSGESTCCGDGDRGSRCIADSNSSAKCCSWGRAATVCGADQTCCGGGDGGSSTAFCCDSGLRCCQPKQADFSADAQCCGPSTTCCAGDYNTVCCGASEACDTSTGSAQCRTKP